MKNIIELCKEWLVFVLLIVPLYILLNLIGISCPIKFVTGISCAGCGMTRAWNCLMHGNVKQAFGFHPLFFVPVIFIGWNMIRSKLKERIYEIGIFLMAIGFIVVYIYRLCSHSDVIVVAPKEGFAYLVFKTLFSLGGL